MYRTAPSSTVLDQACDVERPGQLAARVDLYQPRALDVHGPALVAHYVHHGLRPYVKRPGVLPDDARRTARLKRQRSGELTRARELKRRTLVNTDAAGVGSGEHFAAGDHPRLAGLLRAVGLNEDVSGVFVIVSHASTLSVCVGKLGT